MPCSSSWASAPEATAQARSDSGLISLLTAKDEIVVAPERFLLAHGANALADDRGDLRVLVERKRLVLPDDADVVAVRLAHLLERAFDARTERTLEVENITMVTAASRLPRVASSLKIRTTRSSSEAGASTFAAAAFALAPSGVAGVLGAPPHAFARTTSDVSVAMIDVFRAKDFIWALPS